MSDPAQHDDAIEAAPDSSARARTPIGRALDAKALAARLEEEVARATRYGRPLAVVALVAEDAAEGTRALAAAIRQVDVLGRDTTGADVAVLPETGDQADLPASRALAQLDGRGRAGVAILVDGVSAAALVERAVTSARQAALGEVAFATPDPLVQCGAVSAIVADPKTRALFTLVDRLASSDLPVLVTGETGAGKEIVAHALHARAKLRSGKLVSLNCAAVPEALLESELFGYERGAFSGAATSKTGLVEAADRGTLFLDEIGECSPLAQAKLLRVLETKRFTRVGSIAERSVEVRIVAATNRSLEADVAAGRFREDLYYRLSAATIEVPSLRERPLDLAPLAISFLRDASERAQSPRKTFSPGAFARIAAHGWPGNVRELKNVVGYLAAAVDGPTIEAADVDARLGTGARKRNPGSATFRNLANEVRELEARRMTEALEASGGVRMRAAELIGMPLRTFVTKLKQYEIVIPSPRARR